MIIVCPNCHDKPLLNPFEQKAEKACWMCGGRGKVDNEKVCQECGRPAAMLLFDTPVCHSLACQKELTEAHAKKAPLTERDVDAATASMSDAWNGWRGMVG